MSENIIEKMVLSWKEKYGESDKYSERVLNEIATNCASLTNAWFSGQTNKKLSYAINKHDKDGVVFETLHGITKESLPNTMLEIITTQSDKCSKLSLVSYSVSNGEKLTNIIGELEIY